MPLDYRFEIRCESKLINDFKEWCSKGNFEYTDMIREFIKAAPEGRAKITPGEDQRKILKELYE